MTQAVTVYRWDDDGAPQVVDGKPSEYMNIFKKCLVEGYGSKSSLNWSVIDEVLEIPFLSLQNNIDVGSGGALMLDSANNIAGTSVKVQACQDYVAQHSRARESSYFSFYRYSSGGNTIKKWVLIGTGRAFYFFAIPQRVVTNGLETYPSIGFFAGDFDSVYPNDPATFTAFSGSLNSTSLAWNSSLIHTLSESVSSQVINIHPLDGTVDSKSASIISMFSNSFGVSYKDAGAANVTVFMPMYIAMGDGNLNRSEFYQNNNKHPFIRGVLPGLYLANSPGHINDPLPVIKSFDNIDYYLVPSAYTRTGCVWVSLGGW